jgi:hypothetical protein
MDTQTPGTPGDLSGHADAPPAGSAEALSDVLQELLQQVDAAQVAGRPPEFMPTITRAYEQLRAYDASLRGQVAAWLPRTSSFRAEVVQALADRDHNVLGRLHYTDTDNDMTGLGWTRVGEASITLRAFSQAALLDEHVKALRARQAEARARAQAVDTEFDRQIQSLMAIELK